VGEYLAERVDKPLEEVDDAVVSSQVLNFVESDGLSRVRVCHVGFTPFIPKPPNELETEQNHRCGRVKADGGGFAFSRWNIRKTKEIGRFGCGLGLRSSDALSSPDSNLHVFFYLWISPAHSFHASRDHPRNGPLARDTFEP